MDEIAVVNRALSALNKPPLTLNEGESWRNFRPSNKPGTAAVAEFDAARRDALAERPWNFATVKDRLIPSDYVPPEASWNIVYKFPTQALKFVNLVDIFSSISGSSGREIYPDGLSSGSVTLQVQVERAPAEALFQPDGSGLSEFASESWLDWFGRWEVRLRTDTAEPERVILTNLPQAVGQYVVDVPQVYLWSPQFTTALAYLLANRMGPALGEAQLATRAFHLYTKAIDKAQVHDANESNARPRTVPSHLRARRRG